ncbi:MAG TPA: hypothetical protein VFJ97_08200 [Dermatophilaceae bacterium]|nr:hypothetical protein [Dermatophilaceae bacterium]
MQWWGWLLVAVAVLVVVGAMVAGIQARRRRGGVVSARGRSGRRQ